MLNEKVIEMIESFGIKVKNGDEFRNGVDILDELSKAMSYMTRAEKTYVCSTLLNQ